MKTICKILIIGIIYLLSNIASAQIYQYSDDGTKSCIDCEEKSSETGTRSCECDFPEEYNNIARILAQYDAQQKAEWLAEQQKILKEEIEKRMGRFDNPYDSFRDALEDFYGAFEGRDFAKDILNDLQAQANTDVSVTLLEKDKNFYATGTAYHVISLNNQGASSTLGDLKMGNINLANMPNDLAEEIIGSLDRNKREIEEKLTRESRLQSGVPIIKQDDSFENRLINDFINYYNSYGVENKVKLVTAYLIKQNFPFRPLTPLPGHAPPPFWSPNREHYLNVAENLAANRGTAEPVTYPNVNIAQATANFAVSTFGDDEFAFYADNPSMHFNMLNYLSFKNYNQSSLDFADNLLSSFASNTAFPHNEYQYGPSNSVAFQNEASKNLAFSFTRPKEGNLQYWGVDNIINDLHQTNRFNPVVGEIIQRMAKDNGIDMEGRLTFAETASLFEFKPNEIYNAGPNISVSVHFRDNIGEILWNSGYNFPELLSDSDTMKATLATLTIIDADLFATPDTNKMLEAIQPYFDVNTTDPLFQQYLIAQIAIERLNMEATGEAEWCNQNPKQCGAVLFWRATREVVHLTLDLIGLVPVVGEVADITNGALYTIRGDYTNASLSYAGAIPFAGWFATGAKLGYKTLTNATGKVIKLRITRTIANTVKFGSRSTLRKVLGLTDKTIHAHHIIPWEFLDFNIIQKAAKSKMAFHMNEILNGIGIKNTNHLTGHNKYNNVLRDILNRLDLGNPDPDMAYELVEDLAGYLKNLISNNPNLTLGEIADLIQYP